MRFLFLFLLFFIPSALLHAQADSSYVRAFPQDFSLRPYFYYKFTALQTAMNGKEVASYHPNIPVGLGLGIAYKNYALNLAYAPSFFRDKDKGKTKYFDLQYHYYSRKYLFDFFFQDYKGFYHTYDKRNNKFDLYPDIHVIQYGAGGQYVFNHRKFSYRAAFYCNEKQVRSAGSFQVGGGLYYNKLLSDTTNILNDRNWFRNYQLSITGGYIYTWVFKQNYFITAGVTGGINLGLENLKNTKGNLEVTPTFFPRIAMGYNGDKWALLFNFVINRMQVTRSGNMDILFNTGRLNVMYVYRFENSPAILKKIKILNR